MGIEYHGNQGLKGMGERKNIQNRKTVSELLLTKSTTSSKIRLRLIKEGYKEEKCEVCGLTEWMGKPIPLELHHKDFNHHNNDIENLQILCSNCHMQIKCRSTILILITVTFLQYMVLHPGVG